MNEKLHKTMIWGVVVSEASHLFCCVFPTVFSLLSLLVGVGVIAAMPGFMVEFHDLMHRWELPVIVFSGVVIALSWGAVWYSRRIGCCHHTGCSHGSCAPVKRRAHVILVIATVLFVFNVAVYVLVHRGALVDIPALSAQSHDHHDHDNHPHNHQ